MGIALPAGTTAQDIASPRWWAKVLSLSRISPSDGTITDESFQPRLGNAVIGRAENTPGAPADIQLAPDEFLANRAGVVQGTTLVDADVPASIARDAEVTAAAGAAQSSAEATAAAALAAHVGAADPHPGYLTPAEGNAAYQPLAAVLAFFHSGTGSPETVLTAPVGHVFLRTDGGAATTLYVKESGVGNTGWVAK